MRGYRFSDTALEAPLWALLSLAEVAAEVYDRIENPGKYGDHGSMQAAATELPRLRAALEQAGLLL
jgi:hypothetical protein